MPDATLASSVDVQTIDNQTHNDEGLFADSGQLRKSLLCRHLIVVVAW
jgi:hypothetical protein